MKNFGVKNWCKENAKELMLSLFLTILNIFFLNYSSNLYSISKDSKRYFLLLFFSIIFELMAVFIILRSKKKKWNLEKIFLMLFIPIGLIYMIAIPIGRVPDEPAHLARAYGITNGHFITTANENGEFGEYLPAGFENLKKSNTTYIFAADDGDESYIFMNDSGSALYNFVNYIPQSLGILVGRILHLPIFLIAYLGRLFNFICFTILFYFAIKKIPFGKIFLFFIAFLPIVLQEAVSLSADCLAISISAAFISYVLYLAYDKNANLDKKNYLLLIVLMVIQSLCKIVYLPFCFLIFLIPKSKFKTKKDYLLKTILPILVALVINIIWLKIASQYLIENNPGVNSGEQIQHIISSPFSYLQTIFNTCIASMYQFAYGIFGGWLEWLDVEIGHIYVVLSIIIASIIIYKTSEEKVVIPLSNKTLLISIEILVIAMIFTSLYVQWNPVGSGFIGGLQGRYFLPTLLLAPAIACKSHKKSIRHINNKEISHSSLYLFSIFQSFAAVIVIICSHLGGA